MEVIDDSMIGLEDPAKGLMDRVFGGPKEAGSEGHEEGTGEPMDESIVTGEGSEGIWAVIRGLQKHLGVHWRVSDGHWAAN